ncbi:hypothetical protein VNO78_23604 [Psophocarpus tetragonolobus]|uniref:Uncharacterized protein n=1 Tax=Psophocarpus tetragonolobus TaxID=3891 RepID=A0AAN9S4F3_PSOTE
MGDSEVEAIAAGILATIVVPERVVVSHPTVRQGHIVYHYNKERVAHLDHCTLTPKMTSLWSANLALL